MKLFLHIAAAVMLLAFTACNNQKGPVIIECGGPGEFACPRGSFCDLGASCGGFDAVGQCRRLISNCPNERVPVCGCNKQTYLNACYAHGSGVSIHYEGECIKPTVERKAKRKNLRLPGHRQKGRRQ